MNSIREALKEKRPSLSDGSLRTYASTLKSVYDKVADSGDDVNVSFYTKNKSSIIELLKDKKPSSRKTYLSALYILTGLDDYKELMMSDSKETNDFYRRQVVREDEKVNYIPVETIDQKVNSYFNDITKLFNQKKKSEMVIAQIKSKMNETLILSFLSGVFIPPRRNLDYALMKIRNFDRDTDNFYLNGVFTFNIYKTVRTYGKVEMNVRELAPKLDQLIKKWIKLNETDYMLPVRDQNKPISSSGITQALNSVFERKTSTNQFRHTYITKFYRDRMPTYEQMEELSKLMGHSINQQLLYIKNNIQV